jgi:hypothetical protein
MRSIALAALTLFAAGAFGPSPALAWDDEGHRVVAEIATHYLTAPALGKVYTLLGEDKDTPVSNDVAAAAVWADKIQDRRVHNWHFAKIDATRPNIPAACFGQPALPAGEPASMGPERDCVIDKIDQFADELADPKMSRAEQIIALKFLLNLVADLHQPLRVADEGDSHGMKTAVVAKETTPGDLFTFWDKVLVIQMGVDPKAVAQKLIAGISEYDRAAWISGGPHLWALESHQLGVDGAYGMVGRQDAKGNSILSDDDVAKAQKIAATQLSRAGVRLAYILNDALAPIPAGTAPAVKTLGNSASGRAFALASCSVCHVVAQDQKTPRDSTTAPDFQAIANTRGMTQVAMRTFLSSPHPTMPNLKLSTQQSMDVTAFIVGLKKAAR